MKTKIILAILIPFVLTLAPFMVSAASLTDVSVSPMSETVTEGQTFTVNIIIDPSMAIAGAQANLNFNPSLIYATDVEDGNLFTQTGHSDYFFAGTTNNTSGEISNIACVILGAYSDSESGTFATISFTAIASGTVNFTLSDVMVGNQAAQQIPITIIDSDGAVASPIYSNLTGNYYGTLTVRAYNLDGTFKTNYHYLAVSITSQNNNLIPAAALSLRLTNTDPSPIVINITGLDGPGQRPRLCLSGVNTDTGNAVLIDASVLLNKNHLPHSITGTIAGVIPSTGPTVQDANYSVSFNLLWHSLTP
jgi:hypothetical protein